MKAETRLELLDDESGFSLVEVIVAMVIFAVIATSVAVGAATALKMTGDTRDREAATQLAASEIDAVRAISDPFSVNNATRTTRVGETVFTIARTAQWVQGAGGEACRPGATSTVSNLQYKRINVEVSWQGQIGSRSSARADTLLAPKSRLNDPSLGTILVSVLGADGTGRSGVSINVSGDSALGKAPAPTDADGCTYVLLVKPGKWTVTATRAGYIDTTQSSAPSKTVTVTAGASSSALFQYDAQATIDLDYPADTVAPSNLEVAFLNTYGLVTRAGRPASAVLHPYTAGYSVLAGHYVAPTVGTDGAVTSVGCTSSDPGAWSGATLNGKTLAAGTPVEPVATAPGGRARAALALGIVELNAPTSRLRIVAAPAASDVGDPGCAEDLKFTYSLSAAGPVRLAVPFGTWRIEASTNGTNWTVVDAAASTVPTNAAGELDGPNGTTTVDPRAVAP